MGEVAKEASRLQKFWLTPLSSRVNRFKPFRILELNAEARLSKPLHG